ncbi:MAG: hypothetical protein IPM16_21165 [Chloroflexi bacterium]|nr:hypothetical protein [Chloroflexota bacterium]
MTAPTPPMPGMSLYFLAIYTKGPIWSPESTPQTEETQRAHLAYNGTLAENGTYKIVGPFYEPPDPWRGMLLIKANSLDQARALVDGDPAVQSGRLRYEITGVWLLDALFE